jgi:hemoglobin
VKKTFCDKLSGECAVDAAGDIVSRKALTDDTSSPLFDAADMDAQRAKQKVYLTMACGGPNAHQGKDLRTAHARLVKNGLDGAHFDAVAGHLQATPQGPGVAPKLIEEVMTVAGSTRGDVRGR